MTKLHSEQPIISPDGPRRQLARQIDAWIREQPIESDDTSPAPRGHVAGIYGGRGSGKTSVLYTLLEELQSIAREQASSPTSDDPPLMIPKPKGRDAVFRPAETRTRDGLMMMVVAHLRDAYAASNGPIDAESARTGIKHLEVELQDTARILDFLKDISPSSNRLKDAYAETLFNVATGTNKLREHFSKLLEGLTCVEQYARKAKLVLLIDDIDLQPQRALELLEILHLFLDLPQVFILVAADKALLIQAIDLELKRRDVHRQGLAAALLAKYVPYSWDLPVAALEDLSKGLQRDHRSWWNLPTLEELLRLQTESPFPVVSAPQALRNVGPQTYRQFKALENTLRSWETRLVPNMAGARLENEADLHRAVDARYDKTGEDQSRLGLLPPLTAAFLVLLACVDVQWPDLGVLEALELEPDRLVHALQLLAEPASQQAPTSEFLELPILAALHDSSRFSPEQRGRARHALVHLANVLRSWRTLNAGAAPDEHFLFVSFYGDANAPQTFRSLWDNVLSDTEAERAHLDLREYAPDGRPSGQQVHRAVDEAARAWLARLRETPGRITLCAEAPLSFLVWLGHLINHRRPVVAWNARDLLAFDVPEKLEAPDRGGQYDACSVQWRAEPRRARRANLILDFLGRSTEDDLSAFPPPEEDEPAPWLECRLIYLGGSASVFDYADRILLDTLELLSELKRLGVTTLHLGLIMPDVVAFAVGRQLKSRGFTVVLYERKGASYQRSLTLEG